MIINFKTNKLEKIFNSEKNLVRVYGSMNAAKIKRRMDFLKAAPSLEDVPQAPPFRRHPLHQNREGQFAVDLKHPHRLVLEPNHEPLPVKANGDLDLTQVTAITILGVEDYH